MAMLTLDCARCPAKRMTHDVLDCSTVDSNYEYFVRCRACSKTSIWNVGQVMNQNTPQQLAGEKAVLDGRILVGGLVRPRASAVEAPDHTPPELKLIFDEGAECLAIGAWNASSAMFRKIVDQISKERMNSAPSGPPADKRTRFNLKPRLEWLFANNLLPKEVEPLANAIREDGNDGVHNAPLGELDALDLQDFTVELLEVLYTLPGRLRDAEARRAQRRGQS
jgi:Domain of unknown function (DUF4145)